MGLSYIMDSVLYICLAITFVLILLIVYHFKQRVSALEAKQDTMFELVNNMVQEMQNMRVNSMAPPIPPPMPQEMHDAIFSELSGMPSMIHIGGNPGFMDVHNHESHSVEELDTDGDVSDEDESDEDEDSDEDEYTEEEDENAMNKGIRDTLIDLHSIKQIQVESTTLLDEIPSVHLSMNDIDVGDVGDVGDIGDIGEIGEFDYEKENELSVSKSDEVYTEAQQLHNANDNNQQISDVKYKDLHLRQLKTLANERGLATNTNRMKKADLIDILEKADAPENTTEMNSFDE